MNMLHYNEYINSRINNGSPISSDFETVEAFIVDTYSPKESFAFYLLTNDECYECTCEVREVNHQNRFRIKTI